MLANGIELKNLNMLPEENPNCKLSKGKMTTRQFECYLF
jgi:hypothetical protein